MTDTVEPETNPIAERIAHLTALQKQDSDGVLTLKREVTRLTNDVNKARDRMLGRAARIDELKRLEADSG